MSYCEYYASRRVSHCLLDDSDVSDGSVAYGASRDRDAAATTSDTYGIDRGQHLHFLSTGMTSCMRACSIVALGGLNERRLVDCVSVQVITGAFVGVLILISVVIIIVLVIRRSVHQRVTANGDVSASSHTSAFIQLASTEIVSHDCINLFRQVICVCRKHHSC